MYCESSCKSQVIARESERVKVLYLPFTKVLRTPDEPRMNDEEEEKEESVVLFESRLDRPSD